MWYRCSNHVPRTGHFAFRCMKQKIRIAAVVAVLTVAVYAQTGAPPRLTDFEGTFTAEFHKKTWLVLTLASAGNKLTGTFKHSVEISSDDEGDITKVGDEMSSDPIVQAELDGQDLEITTKDDDGDQDHYRLTLTGPDSAELKSEVGNGSNGPKPFKLKRSAPADPNSKAAPQGGLRHKK